MTATRHCHYCGWRVAKIRRPGEPATCLSCRDLPARERAAELEVDPLLERYYNGDAELEPVNPQAERET